MPVAEFLVLVRRLPVGSHFYASRVAEHWSSVEPSDAAAFDDTDPRAWRDWTPDLRMIADLVNEVRALRVSFYNTFQQKPISFSPVRTPGSGLPVSSSDSGDDDRVISTITGGFTV